MIISSAGKSVSSQVSPSKNEIVFDPNLNESELERCKRKVRIPSTPSSPAPQPTGLSRPKTWTVEVEEIYRFQTAGYRDLREYCHVHGLEENEVSRWPHNGYVKMLHSLKGAFIYFDKERECQDKDLNKCKIFNYSTQNS